MQAYRELYHVTPEINRASIMDQGICPSYSLGRQNVSWYVEKSRIMWAIAHVSARHDVPVSRIIVLTAVMDGDLIKRTAWIGVYTYSSIVPPSRVGGLVAAVTVVSMYVELNPDGTD